MSEVEGRPEFSYELNLDYRASAADSECYNVTFSMDSDGDRDDEVVKKSVRWRTMKARAYHDAACLLLGVSEWMFEELENERKQLKRDNIVQIARRD